MKYVSQNGYSRQNLVVSDNNAYVSENTSNCNNNCETNCVTSCNINHNDNCDYICNTNHEQNCNNNCNTNCNTNCNINHNSNCEDHNYDCDTNNKHEDKFVYVDLCDKQQSCSSNNTNQTSICTYLDIICDECDAVGTPLIIPVEYIDSAESIIHQQYKSCSDCCHTCVVDESSIYTIEKMGVNIKSISLVNDPLKEQILINGIPALSVTAQKDGSYIALLPLFNNEGCYNKSSVVFNNLGDWNILVEYSLFGVVTTQEGNCKFDISFENSTILPLETDSTSTFICPEISIANVDENSTPYMRFKFFATAQLVSPILKVVEGKLQFNSTLLVNPIAKLEVIKNAKVCLNTIIK